MDGRPYRRKKATFSNLSGVVTHHFPWQLTCDKILWDEETTLNIHDHLHAFTVFIVCGLLFCSNNVSSIRGI